ncbi:MAG: PQQ-dependent sugar dehydrogenase [Stackebrandtia sp.]
MTIVFATGACAFGDPPPDETGNPPNLPEPSDSAEDQPDAATMLEAVATGLETPWGIAFLPDESALVTERDTGKILSITPPEEEGKAASVEEVQVIEEAVPSGEGGLLGIAVSPDYKDDETIFVYYTAADDNRIASLKLGEDPDPIVTGIPKADHHNGGALAFGPDGMLYAGTGDAGDDERSQDEDSLGGKILRMDDSGDAPGDNPFGDSLVYAKGIRNSQGLTWDAEKQLYAADFGADSADELNRIEAGKNYGWPEVEGVGDDGDFEDPLVVWTPDEASCSGMAYVKPVLVTACLRGERLWTVELTDKGTVTGEPAASLAGELGRLRAVVEAPDGTLWISTSNTDGRGEPRDDDDQIVRVSAGSDTGGGAH